MARLTRPCRRIRRLPSADPALIGTDPGSAHLATCDACTRFAREAAQLTGAAATLQVTPDPGDTAGSAQRPRAPVPDSVTRPLDRPVSRAWSVGAAGPLTGRRDP